MDFASGTSAREILEDQDGRKRRRVGGWTEWDGALGFGSWAFAQSEILLVPPQSTPLSGLLKHPARQRDRSPGCACLAEGGTWLAMGSTV